MTHTHTYIMLHIRQGGRGGIKSLLTPSLLPRQTSPAASLGEQSLCPNSSRRQPRILVSPPSQRTLPRTTPKEPTPYAALDKANASVRTRPSYGGIYSQHVRPIIQSVAPTLVLKAQLPADHLSRSVIPVVVADRPPLPADTEFHTAFVGSVSVR